MASQLTNCTTVERYSAALAQIELNIAHLEQLDPTNWELPRLHALCAEWKATIARYS